MKVFLCVVLFLESFLLWGVLAGEERGNPSEFATNRIGNNVSQSWVLGGKNVICNASDSIAMGDTAQIRHTAPGSIAIGDFLLCDEPNTVLIGTHYMGEKIPDNMREALQENPDAVRWLLSRVVEAMNKTR